MLVEDKEMYHFHKDYVYNDLWVPNNEIIVDDHFESNYGRILKVFDTTVPVENNERQSFDGIINKYLKEEQDTETYIRMLRDAQSILYKANVFKRELALELIRRKKYPNLPSRCHSIWLCDENGLDFWRSELPSKNIDVQLFKVLVSGNIFKTSDSFIPGNDVDFFTNIIEAYDYWDPVFQDEEQENRAEYLFQGKVKVLKRME